MSEKELLDRLRTGDEAAFSALVEDYHPQLLRLARMFVPSDAVAQEVVQETWLGVLNGLEKFEGRSSLKTWIFRILTNRAKTRGTREGRTVPFSALSDEDEPSLPPDRFTERGSWQAPPARWGDEEPEQMALNKELRGVIEQAVAKLPQNQAVVLTLRDIQGWSAKETCNLLEISETNQRVLLHRARTKLRQVLETYQQADR